MTWERCAGSHGYGFKDSHGADPGAKDGLCQACRVAMLAAEARTQPKDRSWQLFAEERDGGFEHFYGSTIQVRMCGNHPIALVRLVLDTNGSYYGWYHSFHPHNGSHRGTVSMIYTNRVCVEICFSYGPEAETAIVRLRAERIRDAVHPEHVREGE